MTATEAPVEAVDTVTCEICSHPLDPHIMLTLEPMKGGIGRCPVKDCNCHFTWSPQGVPKPDDLQVEIMSNMWITDRARFPED